MKPPLTVLIVGGYGTFGGRLVRLLESEPRLTLIVAGRSLDKAIAFCKARGEVAARLSAAAFDRTAIDIEARLVAMRPGLVIDASGPFQAYDGYGLVEACLALGIPYADLADGSDFVAGIERFDAAARARGIFILSGASTCPALTGCVVRKLAAGWTGVETIAAGIAPSPRAGLGANVIRAIASYAGKPVPIWRDGGSAVAYPLTEHRHETVAPPGALPLDSRLFSLCDAPDLRIMPRQWPGLRSVWVGAATVPAISQRLLIACAWLVRLRLLPSLSFLASAMYAATRWLRWGEHRGGMFVAITGFDAAGSPARRSWHLVAEGDDGPFIPAMAAAAIVRRMLAGDAPRPGARAAIADLDLAEYEHFFAGLRIRTGIREDDESLHPPPHRRLLGEAWDRMPAEFRAMHDIAGTVLAEGRASVERGANPLARLIGALVGFPKAAPDVAVAVRFAADAHGETWTRTFARKSFSSYQFAGSGRWRHLLCESFGPLTFAMAPVIEDGRMSLHLRGWSALGIPMPLWLGVRETAIETVENGRFHFHVEIGHPLAGPIVRYRGWLARKDLPRP